MRLQTYLTRNGIGIDDFALAIGVSSLSTVYRYLRAERTPTARVMERIHRLTEGAVTADDFFHARLTRRSREAQA